MAGSDGIRKNARLVIFLVVKFRSAAPKLKKFQGKPRDYSPKARMMNILGYSLPFDRHDWIVDRCGTDVTYIIDFYQGKGNGRSPASIYLDVRPTLTFGGALDRMKMMWNESTGQKTL